MGTVVVRCPTTGRVIPVGFAGAGDTFHAGGNAMATVLCLACGEIHRWQKKDAWVEPAERHPSPHTHSKGRRRHQ